MATKTTTEYYDSVIAQARLKQMRVQRRKDKEGSFPGAYVYYSPVASMWLVLTNQGDVYRFDWYKGCPCG